MALEIVDESLFKDLMSVIPFRVRLEISQAWYQLKIMHDEPELLLEDCDPVKLFFGYFTDDRSRTVFPIFRSIYVDSTQQIPGSDPPLLHILPVGQLFAVEFNYVYYCHVTPRFLKECRFLQSLERVVLPDYHLPLLPRSLDRLVFSCLDYLSDSTINHLNRMFPDLRYFGHHLLNFASAGENGRNAPPRITQDLSLSNLRRMNMSEFIPERFSFSLLPSLREVRFRRVSFSNAQIAALCGLSHLHRVFLDRVRLGTNASLFFSSPSLRLLFLTHCKFSWGSMSDVSIPNDGSSRLEFCELRGIEHSVPSILFEQIIGRCSRIKSFIIGNCERMPQEDKVGLIRLLAEGESVWEEDGSVLIGLYFRMEDEAREAVESLRSQKQGCWNIEFL